MEFLKECYLNEPLLFMTWILVVLLSFLTAFIVISLVTSGTIAKFNRPHKSKKYYKLCKYCKRVYLRKDAYLINCPTCNGYLKADIIPLPISTQRIRVALWQLVMQMLVICLCLVMIIDMLFRANKNNSAILHLIILSFIFVLSILNTYRLAKLGAIEVKGNTVIVRQGLGNRIFELTQTWVSMSEDGKNLIVLGAGKKKHPDKKTFPCSALNREDVQVLFREAWKEKEVKKAQAV